MTTELSGSRGRKKPARAPRGRSAGEPDPFYILATSPLADEQRRVLKHGETFAVFDHAGDITPGGLGEQGLYREGTRYLSSLLLQVGNQRPLFLSSTVNQDNDLLTVDLTNLDAPARDHLVIPRGTLHLFRAKFLWHGVCYERLHVRNHGPARVETALTLHFEADFADIFEVRGTRRPQRGHELDAEIADSALTLAYEGLDGVVRRARIQFSPRPSSLTEADARFDLSLGAREEATILVTVACEAGAAKSAPLSYDAAFAVADGALQGLKSRTADICTSSEQCNAWLNRTAADLHMMTTDTEHGPYPYAGVPWFSTVFGRDGLLTAFECLWIDPDLARGVLSFLAATQAREVIPEKDAEPGKILHEMRKGEMAALGEIPFGLYYGSVDATPLFVLLAAAYYERTADRAFSESIWPNVERALEWIDTYGDPDRDGFVEYQRHSSKGLVQQGWKDSHDSIFHADGRLAEPPIALCEVQGYVYAAQRGGAALALALGLSDRAAALLRQAKALQEHFEQAFWCEELGTYALALDGRKDPCCVRTSNAGHCLMSGIAEREHARRTGRTLLAEDSFSGWGVRSVGAAEARYNPMSYHNGSVWPHDNALLAAGLARYGLQAEVLQIFQGLFDASQFLDLHRLPELFCGFTRRPGEGPTLYPVACSPQSWAAASVYLLLQACLGLTVNGPDQRVSFAYPRLPRSLHEVRISNLRVGDASVDLLLRRHGDDVGINVLHRTGSVEVVMVK
jgi:glycogen debranching enzyme